MKPTFAIAAAVLSGAVLAACAADAQAPSKNAANTPARSRACFTSTDVDNWKSADPLHLLLRVKRNQIYRADLVSPCYDLDFSIKAAITPGRSVGSSFICEGDEINITTASADRRRDVCRADRIHLLTPQEVSAMAKKDLP